MRAAHPTDERRHPQKPPHNTPRPPHPSYRHPPASTSFTPPCFYPTLRGWAQNLKAREEPVHLEILSAGRLVAHLLAYAYRPDLRTAALGSGCHGFSLTLPAALPAMQIRRAQDGALLTAPPAKRGVKFTRSVPASGRAGIEPRRA